MTEPTIDDLCPENKEYACLSVDTMTALAEHENAQQRTLNRLESCPWVIWY